MMVKKIKISGSPFGVILSNDDDLQAFLKKKGIQSLLDNEGFEVITFAPLVSGSTYTLGPNEVLRPPLRIFDLVFQDIPTGSSGAPHILQDLEDFPLDQLRPLQLQQCGTRLFRRHHQELDLGEGKVYYSRKIQVQDHCDKLVKDVIESCQYDLRIDTEASLNGQNVDIGMLRTRNDAVCGIMEVKQPCRKHAHPPDPNPMDHPKVVMHVLLQMIPLRTMYGVRNTYGVLSTYKGWRFFRWVQEGEVIDADNASIAAELGVSEKDVSEKDVSERDATAKNINYTTLRKTPSGRQSRVSPAMSPEPYCDSSDNAKEEEEEEGEGDVSPTEFKQGTLYASEVIADGPRALGVLAWVLGEMANSPICNVPAHQRDYLYVVKKDSFGGYAKLEHTPEHYKGRMPTVRNETLYILEELGHRHKRRVFRAMSKNGNLCVLKYFVKGQRVVQPNGSRVEADVQTVARKAVEYWNTQGAIGSLPLFVEIGAVESQ